MPEPRPPDYTICTASRDDGQPCPGRIEAFVMLHLHRRCDGTWEPVTAFEQEFSLACDEGHWMRSEPGWREVQTSLQQVMPGVDIDTSYAGDFRHRSTTTIPAGAGPDGCIGHCRPVMRPAADLLSPVSHADVHGRSLAKALEALATEAMGWGPGWAPALTCKEADALVDILTLVGYRGAADVLLAGHAVHDEEGDRHLGVVVTHPCDG